MKDRKELLILDNLSLATANLLISIDQQHKEHGNIIYFGAIIDDLLNVGELMESLIKHRQKLSETKPVKNVE